MNNFENHFPIKISSDGVISSVTALQDAGRSLAGSISVSNIGRAWKKQARNGRTYYKMKFEALRTRNGCPLYVQAWSRRSDPNTFDAYAELVDAPYINLLPSFSIMVAKLKSSTAMPASSLLGV